MEINEATFQLLLNKIDALEKSMSDKIDALAKLFDQKIETIENANCKIDEKLMTHEGWLKRHDKDIIDLSNVDALKSKAVLKEVLKYAGVFFLAYVFYQVFPNISEVIK